MIPCPKCGGDTSVKETRPAAVGVRRRRACLDVVCKGRVTTYELAVFGGEVNMPSFKGKR